MNKLIFYCRAGFEKELAAEINDKAAQHQIYGFSRIEENSGYLVFECYHTDDADYLAQHLN